MYDMKNDGIETYVEIDGERIVLSEEDIQKINSGFEFDGKEFVEGEKAKELQKNEVISQYQGKQGEIDQVKNEIQEINDTIEGMSEQGQALSQGRLQILEARLEEFRKEKETIALEGIEKFGQNIISEF